MGYTHYWDRPTHLEPQTWEEFIASTQQLLARMPPHYAGAGGFYSRYPVELYDGFGEEPLPIIGPDAIVFNGPTLAVPYPWDTTKNTDLGHETFALHRDNTPDVDEWTFCKTARKPYDLAVCLVLLNFKHHFGAAVSVSSDGNAEDWAEACRVYQGITDRELPTEGPWHKQPART